MSYHFNSIIVASRNPVKLAAVRAGLEAIMPGSAGTVRGVAVPSGVPDQPFSDRETAVGAAQRAANARLAVPDADCWVGIEGGVDDDGESLLALAWIVIEAADGRRGRARTGTFPLPQEIVRLVRAGHELGEADDLVFGQSNSKQKLGAVGLLTGGAIDRTALYAHGVMLALIPFCNEELLFNN